MNKNDRFAAVFTGIVLFLLAALITLGLIQSVLDFGNVAETNFVYKIGKMLGGSFGISSICIPLFLYFAGAFCFTSRWTLERGVSLTISVIPFYTLSLTEKLARKIYNTDPSTVAGVKIGLLILIAVLLVAAEYLVAILIAGKIKNKNSSDSENVSMSKAKKVYTDSDDTVLMDNYVSTEPETIIEKPMANVRVAPERDIWSIDEEGNLKGEEKNDPSIFGNPDDEVEEEYTVVENKNVPCATASQSEKLFGMPFDEEESENEENFEDIDTNFFATLNPAGSNKKTEDNTYDFPLDASPSQIVLPNEVPEEQYKEQTDDELLDDLIREFEEANKQESENINSNFEMKEDVSFDSVMKSPDVKVTTIKKEPVAETKVNENPTIVVEEDKKRKSLLPGLDNVFAKMDFDAKNDVSDEAIKPDETEDSAVIPESSSAAFEIPDFGEEYEPKKIDEMDYVNREAASEIAPAAFTPTEPIVEKNEEGENVFNPVAPALVDSKGNVKSDSIKEKEIDVPKKSEVKVSGKTAVVTDLNGNTKPIQVTPKKRNRGAYKIPTDLLTFYEEDPYWIIDDETKQAAEYLKQTLQEFKIEADVTGIQKGPVVTMFEILPAPGVKLNRIVALQDNIALRLAASSVRIVAPIPGKRAVGIEVPNEHRAIVSFRECIERNVPEWKKMAVPVVLGKDIEGQTKIMDLVKTPHLLIAGSTGAGKSVCVNSMILSILFKRNPNEVKMILIDPKIVELKLYNDIPHLLTPVITEPKKAMQALQYCLCEMERRYALLDGMGCRDISSYNHKIVEKKIATEHLPYIIVVIDEFADLMATTGKQLESVLARLAAMSRAVGIHLVLATQRPSIDVITGLIKANIPSRIAFMVASKMDSRIIIDQVGAEKLLGKGDMLYASATDPFPVRIQGTFISDQEVEDVVAKVKEWGEPEYIDEEIFVDDEEDEASDQMSLFNDGADDPLYDKALEIVLQAGKASASYIQRRLSVGYNRAARLVELMEERGIVGPANGSKPREIIHMP